MVAPSTRRRVCVSAPAVVYSMQRRSPVSRSKAGGLEIALFGKQFRELRSNFPGVLCVGSNENWDTSVEELKQ